MDIKDATKKDLEIYKKEDILESSTEYFDGDVMAAEVWMNKYALKDMEGNVYELNPEHMHRRIAKEIARYGGDTTDFIPGEIYNMVIDKLQK